MERKTGWENQSSRRKLRQISGRNVVGGGRGRVWGGSARTHCNESLMGALLLTLSYRSCWSVVFFLSSLCVCVRFTGRRVSYNHTLEVFCHCWHSGVVVFLMWSPCEQHALLTDRALMALLLCRDSFFLMSDVSGWWGDFTNHGEQSYAPLIIFSLFTFKHSLNQPKKRN